MNKIDLEELRKIMNSVVTWCNSCDCVGGECPLWENLCMYRQSVCGYAVDVIDVIDIVLNKETDCTVVKKE